jgi:protocatechuate 3,4-dioxygenase, alpha subunit
MMTDVAIPSKRPAGLTVSQTVGPFFHFGLTPHAYGFRPAFSGDMAGPGVTGERISITGQVFDGDGAVIKDVMIELWQADAQGRLDHANGSGNAGFSGFGRSDCDTEGQFRFATIKPGAVAGPNGVDQAPHIAVSIFGRGMPKQLVTRIYFPEDHLAHASDTVLNLVPATRRATLIAVRDQASPDVIYRFDIRLQGPGETVFFDV